jgi:flagellum-specific peptidoglycan hydrolase FlgJ
MKKDFLMQIATAVAVSFIADKIFASDKEGDHAAAATSIPSGAAADYIRRYYSLAQDTQDHFAVPALFTIAQAGLESGWGTSNIARNSNNHFGIKVSTGWNGPSFNGYRKYADPLAGYYDHAKFLTVNKRYRNAFNTSDPDQFAAAVSAAGYSELPNYNSLVRSVMNMVRAIV